MQIHLVDGTYELFRCFFGAPPSSSPEGREIGAVRGIIATLMSLLRDKNTTHVGIAFDTVIESFRNDLFDGYKTGAGIDPNLWSQFPLAEEATRALGLVTWSMIDFEADDAIAAMAARAQARPASEVEKVWLCSPDKDLCQCVDGDRIQLFDRKQDKRLDAAAVRVKFGVDPASIPDLLALVGDDADGIPGIAGFGMKSAAVLLSEYKTVEAIPDDVGAWKPSVRGAEKLAATLKASRKEVALYKKLATLRRDVPLTETIEDLKWRGPDDERLQKLAAFLGDKKLLERVSALVDAKLG